MKGTTVRGKDIHAAFLHIRFRERAETEKDSEKDDYDGKKTARVHKKHPLWMMQIKEVNKIVTGQGREVNRATWKEMEKKKRKEQKNSPV